MIARPGPDFVGAGVELGLISSLNPWVERAGDRLTRPRHPRLSIIVGQGKSEHLPRSAAPRRAALEGGWPTHSSPPKSQRAYRPGLRKLSDR
jgi:hypothetical protein